MLSWFKWIYEYFFYSNGNNSVLIEKLQLAKKQLIAIQTSKQALIKAYDKFCENLTSLKLRKSELDLEKWDAEVSCENSDNEREIEKLNPILENLDKKINDYEDKLLQMKENIDYLHMSERKTVEYVRILYEEARQNQVREVSWNENIIPLENITIDSYINLMDEDDYHEENQNTNLLEDEQNSEVNFVQESNSLPKITEEVRDDHEIEKQLSLIGKDRNVSNAIDALQV